MKKIINNVLLLFCVLFTATLMLSVAKQNKKKMMAVVHNGCEAVNHTSACMTPGMTMPKRLVCKTLPCQ